jgi:hypothetical protein
MQFRAIRLEMLHVPLSLYGVPLSGPTLEQPINVYCTGVLRVLFKFFCGSSGTGPGDRLLLISADSLIADLSTYIYPAILSPLPRQEELLACPNIFIQQSSPLYPV